MPLHTTHWDSPSLFEELIIKIVITLFCTFLLQLLSSLEDYDILVSQVPMWERKLSSLLGDMTIKFDQDSPSVSVTEYLNYLYRVVSSLKKGLHGPDDSTTIQPGELKEFTTRILRFVLFCSFKLVKEL